MIAVIQCAKDKHPNETSLTTIDGKRVIFVANPSLAPHRSEFHYARPDELSDSGETWRETLNRYNRNQQGNPLGLHRAIDLYKPKYDEQLYLKVAEQIGVDNLFILSAGWGLVSGSYLLPHYDITFSNAANVERYKRRATRDRFLDYSQIPEKNVQPVFFFGGKKYVRLFCELTKNAIGTRTVFYNSVNGPPKAPGCRAELVVTDQRTNWHYPQVKSFVEGRQDTQR